MQNHLTDDQIAKLRLDWNAPRRHIENKPEFAGPWNEKFELVKKRLQPGTGTIIGIIGLRGTGKTQMAVEVMRVMTQHGWPCLFTSAVQFFVEVKETFKRDIATTESEILAKYRRPRLLVIDETGKSSDAPWLNTLLFELINCRYNDMKDTILIDNRTKEEFERAIGDSVVSRMTEGGGIVECTWESYR